MMKTEQETPIPQTPPEEVASAALPADPSDAGDIENAIGEAARPGFAVP